MAWAPSDNEDRRAFGGGAGGADQRGIADEDDRAGRRVDLFAVDCEDGVSGHHGEELLMAVRVVCIVVNLVMRLDQLVAGVPGRSADAERLDVEMAAEEMERAAVDVRVLGVDLGEVSTSSRWTEPYGAMRGSLMAPILPDRAGRQVDCIFCAGTDCADKGQSA